MLFAPSGKGRKAEKGRERAKKAGRKRPISADSRKGGQTPLKPPFVTPPAQVEFLWVSAFWLAHHITKLDEKIGYPAPQRHYIAIPAAIYRSAPGPGPESAPRSAF